MDSQALLIKSTSNTLLGRLKYFLYRHIELYIGRKSYALNFVSERCALFYQNVVKKLIVTKLPIRTDCIRISNTRVPRRILIPRPNIDNLNHLDLSMFKRASVQLLTKDITYSEQYSLINFVDDYCAWFSNGGLVLLLDKGGAGVPNRFLISAALGLPIIATFDALRGIDWDYSNLLLVSNDMNAINSFIKDLDFTKLKYVDEPEQIKNYFPSEAVKPLIALQNEF
jgi:hypothetical protein